ncbi:MAG TPA: hypothetical protein VF191_04285 [Cyclobacteriaceae bacterium]
MRLDEGSRRQIEVIDKWRNDGAGSGEYSTMYLGSCMQNTNEHAVRISDSDVLR